MRRCFLNFNQILFCLTLSIFLSAKAFSQLQENSEATFDKEASDIYQSLGVSEIPKEAFDQAFITFQALKGRGQTSRLPLITFVNFSIPSDQTRLFIVDLQNKSVLLKSKVAHGKNSGGVASPASRFSNIDNSLQSSLGFYLTGEQYSGKHGRSLRLDGQSAENSNARNRDIVIHAASYVEGGGRSYGCLALPPSVNSQAIELLKNKTLIFAFTSNQIAKLGDKRAAVVANVDKSYDRPPNVSSVKPEFADFSDFANIAEAKPSIGFIGAAGAGITLLKGSDKFEGCQNLSNKSWAETAKGIESGINPSSYFTGSWVQLKKEISDNEIENAEAIQLSQKRFSDINDCVAVAHVSTRTDFKKDNINASESKKSKDGKIKCTYNSPESQDYATCIQSIEIYENLTQEEKEIHSQQAESLKQDNADRLGKLNIGSAQEVSLKYSKEAQNNLSEISLSRANISNEKANLLSAIASKIPTTQMLLDECHDRFAKHGEVSKDEFKSFVKLYSSLPVEATTSNPCANAVSSNINLIQNTEARTQIKDVLKSYGKDINEYTAKSNIFLGREVPVLSNISTNGLQIENSNELDMAKRSEYYSLDHQVEKTISSNRGNYRSSESGGSLTSEAMGEADYKSSMQTSTPWAGMVNTGDTGREQRLATRVEESGLKESGIYNDAFYNKIKQALENPALLADLALSNDQMKEYLEQKKYYDSLKKGQVLRDVSSLDNGSQRQQNPVFYHDKALNLFEIISLKYQEIYQK